MTTKDKLAKIDPILLFGFAILVVEAIVLVVFWNKLPPQLPWLYSFPWGEKQLIAKEFFGGVVGGGVVLLGLTKVVADWAGKDDDSMKKVIAWGGFMAVLLSFLSFVRVVLLFV